MYYDDISKAYLVEQIATNHPIKNTILLYEACIAKLHAIKKHLESLRFSKADEEIDKVERILLELQMQLNPKTKEISEELNGWYNELLDELMIIKMQRNTDNIPNMEVVLLNLIETFEEVLKKNGA